MLIVAVGFDASGKIRTLRPFDRRYSVIPSTDASFRTPFGSCGAAPCEAAPVGMRRTAAASARAVRSGAAIRSRCMDPLGSEV
jgi:hypothetical protein